MASESSSRVRPTLAQWQRLYGAMDEFAALAPWQWLYDQDIFAVVYPATGEYGYCSIMGRGGEHFALGVYPGASGWASFCRISSGGVEPADVETMVSQH